MHLLKLCIGGLSEVSDRAVEHHLLNCLVARDFLVSSVLSLGSSG